MRQGRQPRGLPKPSARRWDCGSNAGQRPRPGSAPSPNPWKRWRRRLRGARPANPCLALGEGCGDPPTYSGPWRAGSRSRCRCLYQCAPAIPPQTTGGAVGHRVKGKRKRLKVERKVWSSSRWRTRPWGGSHSLPVERYRKSVILNAIQCLIQDGFHGVINVVVGFCHF